MGPYGSLMVFMCCYFWELVFTWVFMGSDGLLCVFIGFYSFLFVLMDSYGFL